MKYTKAQIVLLGVLAAWLSGRAAAQDCVPGSPQRAHLFGCLVDSERAVDGEMQMLIARMKSGFWDPESVTRLDAAQEAWESFVEADCAFREPSHAGREWAIGRQACVNAHKADRVDQLKRIPACGNGCVYN